MPAYETICREVAGGPILARSLRRTGILTFADIHNRRECPTFRAFRKVGRETFVEQTNCELILLLASKLTRIALVRRTKGLLENQLANTHTGHEFNLHNAVIAYFQLNRAGEAGMDSWSSDVDSDSQPCQ